MQVHIHHRPDIRTKKVHCQVNSSFYTKNDQMSREELESMVYTGLTEPPCNGLPYICVNAFMYVL
jgi:hypothetical protein